MDTNTEEIPHHFICPISLEIMKDPVTAPTGITYDRQSIERWLFVHRRLTCPVTNNPLPSDADLTPNHTLRRLIQSWSILHIATPRPPPDSATVQNLLRNILSFLSSATATATATAADADAALSLLISLRVPADDLRPFVSDNHEIIHFLTTIISQSFSAIIFLKTCFDLASPKLLKRLKVEAFQSVVGVIRDGRSKQGIKAALQMLMVSCPCGTNRAKMVEAGAVAEIVEMELSGKSEKRMIELGLGVLEQLCMCADGRAALMGHAAGIAVVAQRMIKVSPAADEKAVGILMAVAKYSATKGEIVKEMMMVGAVSKLCLVMQTECLSGVKEKASWVLRLHSGAWKNSHCFNSDLLSR